MKEEQWIIQRFLKYGMTIERYNWLESHIYACLTEDELAHGWFWDFDWDQMLRNEGWDNDDSN